jgi:DNA-binding NarL/FixJ family response regulator
MSERPQDRIRVLIAEDHDLLRDRLRELLGLEQDVRVVGAVRNGREAVDAALRYVPAIVLMDISMPKMNGIDAIHEIAKGNPTIGVIIISLWDMPVYVQAALNAGARGFVAKMSLSQDLVKAIRAVAAGKVYLGARVKV